MKQDSELFVRLRRKTRYEGDCWLYAGQPATDEAPRLRYRDEFIPISRAVLMEQGHTLTDDDKACHTCDRPWCWNPEHIYKGTYQTNSDDKYARERANHRRGEAKPNAKLTEVDVRYALSLRGTMTAVDAANRTGIPVYRIRRIWSGTVWRHVYVEFERSRSA